jgi:hypothetical protein
MIDDSRPVSSGLECPRGPQLAPEDANFTDEILTEHGSTSGNFATFGAESGQSNSPDHENLVSKVLLDIDAGGAKGFNIKIAEADIDIRVHSSSRVLVTTLAPVGVDLTSFNVAVRARSLGLSFQPKGGLRRGSRTSTDNVRLTLYLPAYFSITALSTTGAIAVSGVKGPTVVRSVSGRVALNELAGSVRAETKSGDISGNCPSKEIHLVTKSGNIDFDGLTGAVFCQTKTGNANLTWRESPHDAKVLIRSGAGPVSLYFPPAAQLNYRFITGANAIMNEFEQCGTSNFCVRIISRRGDLLLKKHVDPV